MTVPMCPVHNQPMRASDKSPGSFYCAQKTDGVWCKERWNPPKTPASAAPPAPPVAADSRTVVAVAALAFASRVYQGSGPVGADEACELAERMFDRMMQRVTG